jgi:hypothetical protein
MLALLRIGDFVLIRIGIQRVDDEGAEAARRLAG